MEQLAFWRNVAVVVLALQCVVMVALGLALGYLLVRLMQLLHGYTETYARKLQGVTRTVNTRTQEYSARAIQPVLKSHQAAARLQQTVRGIFGRAPGAR